MKTMLSYEEQLSDVNKTEFNRNIESSFVTCAQLAAYLTTYSSSADGKMLIIDCGSPLRHSERRIQSSILINVNDKISRKRLSTRGLKQFLDNNQLNRLDNSAWVVLYDDFIRPSSCSNSLISSEISPSIKCIYDEIQRYDTNKSICILRSPYNEFHQQYPSLCYISRSTDEDFPLLPSPTIESIDIESFPLSEILPGLHLGNARDAENLALLKQHDIQFVINVSTSIPCYFENDNEIKYVRLPCHDTSNQNIIQYFESTFEKIQNVLAAKKNVLVHCQGGVSRSPSFVIGYLMRYHSKTFEEARQFVRSKRSIVNPNLHFLGQLTQYEKLLTSA